MIPPLIDTGGPGPFKKLTELETTLLSAHIALNGAGLILYSLRAREEADAKLQMLGYLRALLDALEKIKGHRRVQKVQAGLVAMVRILWP